MLGKYKQCDGVNADRQSAFSSPSLLLQQAIETPVSWKP
jgi:hypothetical protein